MLQSKGELIRDGINTRGWLSAKRAGNVTSIQFGFDSQEPRIYLRNRTENTESTLII